MKYIKLFEDLNSYVELETWAYEYAKTNHSGLNDYDDAVEELDYFFQSEYPNMLNRFKLYRVLQVEDISDINKESLGQHYIVENMISRIYDKPWYENINMELNDYEKLYLVEVEVNNIDVEWYHTIDNRLNYPREYEITLKDGINPKILNISIIDKNKIR